MKAPRNVPHPLEDLSADEIKETVALIRHLFPHDAGIDFRSVSLYEPDRKDLVDFLAEEHKGAIDHAQIDRRPSRDARVVYYLRPTFALYEAIVNITSSKVESNVIREKDCYAALSVSEMDQASKACISHPLVKKEIQRLGLPEATQVVCEPWMYGSAAGEEDNKRKFQCYMFMRDPKNPKNIDGNFYAFPLDFSPVLDAETLDIIKIMYLPTSPSGWDLSRKDQPYDYQGPNEYLPECNELRTDVKALNISQPDGPSFSGVGNLVEWQKWRFRVGFNFREGLVLHDVHIDGRSVFHRLALSEMVVPYADPRPPFHRKAAFDFGDAGAGTTANSLALGCDCLGLIKYFHASFVNSDGSTEVRKNVVCMHEQDDLLLWKHTLANGRVASARSRVLILQTIATLANYEYIFMWIFDQAGGITLELRATGIVSTQPMASDVTEYPYGTIVHPGVAAPAHQHIFCLRMDPAVDGWYNEVVQTDVHPMPMDDDNNPHGVGFVTQKKVLDKSSSHDTNIDTCRVWTIQNPRSKNPITKTPVAWKLHPHLGRMLLANERSYHWKRAGFADHALYLTKYRRDELYASGNFTNQSQSETGVRGWAARNEDLEGGPVVWHSFAMTHLVRTEDFPVMPAAKMHIKLEPSNFFSRNPAVDVPAGRPNGSKSVDAAQNGINGATRCSENGRM